MQIAIIGYGSIGRALARFFKPHNNVVVFDVDRKRAGEAKQSFRVLSHLESLDETYDFIFLCLPTRYNNSEEWTYETVFDVVSQIAPQLNENQFVISTATAMPGYSQKTALRFGVYARNYVYMPLFVRENNTYEDFMAQYPFDGLVFGLHQHMQDYHETFKLFKSKIEKLFEPIYKDKPTTNTIYTTYETAEHIKLLDALNLILRITLHNSYGAVFNATDAHKFVQFDERLGTYGFEYGKPFGGKCLPNYLSGLIGYVDAEIKKQPQNKSVRALYDLLMLAYQINAMQSKPI